MRTWGWMWCVRRERGADALIFCPPCHSCVHAVFFPAVWRKCCISRLQKELKRLWVFPPHDPSNMQKKALCVFLPQLSERCSVFIWQQWFIWFPSFICVPMFPSSKHLFPLRFIPLLSSSVAHIFHLCSRERLVFFSSRASINKTACHVAEKVTTLFMKSAVRRFFCFSIWLILSSLRGAFILKSRFHVLIHFFQPPSETHLQHPEPASVTSPGSTWRREGWILCDP